MITVCICTYNGEKYLSKQLRSIVNQTLLPDEIVVSDDCSTDNTLNIIREFENNYVNIKWKIVINGKRLGYARNFINALKLSNGDYIFLSDQDDIWDNEKIYKMIRQISNHSRIGILFSSYKCIDQYDNPIDFKYRVNNSIVFNIVSKLCLIQQYSYESFVKSMNIAGMSMCIRKQIIDEFLNLDLNSLKFHDLYLAFFASVKGKLYYYNKALVKYRMHENNAIGLNNAVGIKDERVEWLKNNVLNQTLLRSFMHNNSFNIKDYSFIDDLIRFNNDRTTILEKRQLFKTISSIVKLNLFPSISSYLGDIMYVLKHRFACEK